ncbi:translation initiation factor IF-2 [Methylobacterium nodulans]|uniref:Translation initiation factor IF-2 n=1 Tax=Methylobacterium nodulans (strain LMG 21967 / CNCM I-2342 / ORS 2060) TaxID=460265 RepID=B8IBG4_METNO|nr:translation initiation factor IF-2 [Methylobacterium nodulans]ACL57379.1 conserved hypothetical protein [Methylobacterium nodulans ORS 2060]
MIKRSLAAAAVFTIGLATVAQANLTLNQPAPPSSQPSAQTEPTLTQTPIRTAPRAYAEVKTLAPVTQSDADEQPQASKAAPRVIALPRADAPNQGYVAQAPTAAPARGPQPERLSQVEPTAPVQEPTADEPPAPRRTRTPEREVVEAPSDYRRTNRPVGYRTAKWDGGGGATWKTGRDAYGFEGTIGGCRFVGFSGPHGFKLDRTCR